MANDAAVLDATSAGIEPDGSTYVVLTWEDVDEVQGYNLYRPIADAPPRKSRPINGSTPIRPSGRNAIRCGARRLPRVRSARGRLRRGSGPRWGEALEFADPTRFDARSPRRGARCVAATARASLRCATPPASPTSTEVQADQHYVYDLRAVLADGSEHVLAIASPSGPATSSCRTRLGLAAQVGDRRALVLWNRNRLPTPSSSTAPPILGGRSSR